MVPSGSTNQILVGLGSLGGTWLKGRGSRFHSGCSSNGPSVCLLHHQLTRDNPKLCCHQSAGCWEIRTGPVIRKTSVSMGPVKMNGIGGWNTVKYWFWLGSSLSVNNLYSDDFLFYMMFEWFVFVFNVLCFFGGGGHFKPEMTRNVPPSRWKRSNTRAASNVSRGNKSSVTVPLSPSQKCSCFETWGIRTSSKSMRCIVHQGSWIWSWSCARKAAWRGGWFEISFRLDFLCFLSMKHQWNWRIIACRTAISANFCQHQVHAVTCGEMWWREHLLPTGQAWDCKVAFSAAVGREFPSSERGGASRHQTRCWVWSTENPCWSFCQGMLFWRFSVQEYPNISKHFTIWSKRKLRIARKPRMLDRLAQSRCHFSD